jgi:hypothetical protein
MKKMKRITESDLNRIVKKIILEMDNFSDEKLSVKDWEKIWFKLRRLSQSFLFPDFQNYFFTFGSLDFHYNENDGSLELNPFLRDPYSWRDEYDKGVEVLEKYAEKIENFIEESGLDIQFEMGPKFSMKISKK